MRDHLLPSSLPRPETRSRHCAGVDVEAARWTPQALEALMDHLAGRGRHALAALEVSEIATAWQETTADFRDSGSAERRRLEPVLGHSCRLSPGGLSAALDTVLGGVSGESAARLFAQAAQKNAPGSPVVVLLASNLPALALQPLLPALALRRPVLLKSPSAEPLFAPAFLDALTRREPRLVDAVAAVTWPGGTQDLEAPVLTAAGRVLAYGEATTVADVEARAPGKIRAYGPKTSLAAVAPRVDPGEVVDGLARDIALFDQRGCLSIAAVYVEGDMGTAGALATALATALSPLADRWPPGPPERSAMAAVRHLRAEAEMRGLLRPPVADDTLAVGTVVVESRPDFRPTPGLRTVRVQPVADLRRLPELLSPWRDRIQGVALADGEAGQRSLTSALTRLGVSRIAPPGELQSPNALWHNGGVHPLEALGGFDG